MPYEEYLPPGLAGFSCGGGCGCTSCRKSGDGLGGFACGGDCKCTSCRDATARLGERYIADDDEDDDDDESDGPPQPRARTAHLPPTRMRSGLGAWGLGELPPGGPAPRVVFVPGIMGSRLVEARTGIPVWGDNRMIVALANPLTVAAWRLAMGSGNGINSGGVLVPSGLTRMTTVDPYSSIVADLHAAFGAANVLVFAYDWRLSNEHNAGLLNAAIRARFPDASAARERRVTIVAHSMGGLVSRFLIEQLGGAAIVQRLLTVGTPHLGAPEALVALANLGVSHLAAPLLGPVAAIASAALLTLVRRYGSLTQLLPGFDHLIPRGAAGPEGIAATFARLRTDPFWTPVLGPPGGGSSILRSPASRSIRHLNRVLTGALPSLNATLVAGGVNYFTLAGTAHDTTLQVREVAGPIVRAVKARCGDGTVPVHSAALPVGSNIVPLFVASPQPHSDLFNDASVRALCLAVARGTAPASPIPQPGCVVVPPRSGLESALGCTASLPASPRIRASGDPHRLAAAPEFVERAKA